MAALWKATCQSLLKQAGLYERIKGSCLYDAYWRIADSRIVEQRKQELAFFRRTLIGLRRNDLIFDIGANHGVKAEIFLKLGARVIAVDPDVSNQKTLTEHFLAYRLRRKPLVVVGKAVSDRNGHETFWISEPGFEMNTLNAKWAETLEKDPARFGRTFEFREKRQVETITLEQMISTYGRPFYIKIDVEGYEPNVLKGLQTAVPYLSFEVNLPDFKSEGEQCIARLHEIAANGVFNCAVGDRLMFSDWMSHDAFTKAFAEIKETSVEVFWRSCLPSQVVNERPAYRSQKPLSQIHVRSSEPSMVPAEQKSGISTIFLEQSREGAASNCTADKAARGIARPIHVTLLTGGGDKPYALGLATALTLAGVIVDFIGSDDHVVRELLANPRVNFHNLRGDQRPQVSRVTKVLRVLNYYFRLICYTAKAKPAIFHILWNNKIETFDRTLLMLYYKLLGKCLILTVHNVDKSKRDGGQSFLNRFSLRWQYRLSDHIFVHTEKMKTELVTEFGVAKEKVSVIPFGINNTVPNTSLSTADAKQQLGINKDEKTLLFFGNIAPYKGLEYLVAAFTELSKECFNYRLIIAGSVKNCQTYWRAVEQSIILSGVGERIIRKIEYVPDEDTEIYFKAADVLVLPYTYIFQSGVLFLGYSFGLPAIASNTGSMQEDVIPGKTGFIHEAKNADALAEAIRVYFRSDLYRNLDETRREIRDYANERYSWAIVGEMLDRVYRRILSN